MMNLRSIYNKPTNYKILERWIVRDTQPNPGDRIKRLGTIGELRRIPINADNLKIRTSGTCTTPGPGVKF